MASTNERVVECLDAHQSFIVDAGAGSGKTRTLIESLGYLLSTRADDFLSDNQQVVCITYTNVAANEIRARINRDPLVRVSTIHDFLWAAIRGFQGELKEGIISANAAAEPKKRVKDLDLTGMTIEYWQYPRKWAEGKLHHDDIISLSAWMFSTYPKLKRLIADRYPVIFVDEYQDTHESTIKLLLDVLAAGNLGRLTVGLFGDHMQKIYDRGVGKVERPSLQVIQKRENYRCSLAVIDLLNRIRPLLQQVAGSANVQGGARFFYAHEGTADPLDRLRSQLHGEGWNEENGKVLMLTRRGIAVDLGWPDLLAAYRRRGSLRVDDLMRQEDEFSLFFSEIEELASAFADGRYGDFLARRATASGPIRTHFDKQKVADQMGRLNKLRQSAKVGEVMNFVWSEGILGKPGRVTILEERIRRAEDFERAAKDQQFLDELQSVPFSQVTCFERYLNDKTPFSTNHGVKGEEYDNVLVVLDDSLWTKYNFEAVLAGDLTKSQFERTLNLFYVSCSRAQRNLVVLAVSPLSGRAIAGAKRLFGPGNFAEIT